MVVELSADGSLLASGATDDGPCRAFVGPPSFAGGDVSPARNHCRAGLAVGPSSSPSNSGAVRQRASAPALALPRRFSRQGFAQGRVGDGRDHLPLTLFDGNQFLNFAEIFGLTPRPFSEPVETRLFDNGLRAHQFKL
jgi:hypothetical protein